MCGESGGIRQDIVSHGTNETVHDIIQGYEGRDISVAVETTVFYSLMPYKCLNMEGETCHSGNKNKEHLTVLFCSNASSSEKLKPLLTGKFAKRRHFNNISIFPCKYTHTHQECLHHCGFSLLVLMPGWILQV